MKKFTFYLLAFLFSGQLMAQNADHKWAVGLGVGGYNNLENKGTGFMPEMYVSRYISPSFDVLLKQELGIFNSAIKSNLDLSNVFLNARYKFNNGKLFPDSGIVKPYLYGGVGYLFDNQEQGVNFNGGLGLKFNISERIALYVEGGYNHGINTTLNNVKKTESAIKGTFGVEINIGKAKDSDNDGVADRKDICPQTPVGVTVDEKGCPIDTDKDGVADYLDECPMEAGLIALKGCPDKDGDGVADKEDSCPDIAGLKKLKGCPDSDGDGVSDKEDLCPNTPKGYEVDNKGCPKDTDKDGIIDAEDDCPTVPGVKEEKGCPPKKEAQKEIIPEATVPVTTMNIVPVYFVEAHWYITDYSKNKLNKLANLMKSNPNYLLELSGHTDNESNDEYNMELSQKRINSVVDYLTANGVPKTRIKGTKAYGESKPATSNTTARGRQLNRRVEFQLFQAKK